MRKSIFTILAASCGYAAALIGAGFASGQEIVSFFVSYGRLGIIGIVIACAVFALFSYMVMSVCVKEGVSSYDAFLDKILPARYMKQITETVVLICALSSVCVMTACAGETLKLLTGLDNIFGAAAFSLLCGIIFFMDGRKILGINSALGAVIIVGIIFSCFYILRFREHQTFLPGASAAVSGISYAGYNLISVGVILAGMSRGMRGGSEAAISSAVSGMVLFVMITLIWGVLGIYYGKINLGEIPMLTMAFRQNYIFGMFYGIMLMLAVITTGISSGFAVIDMVSKKIPKRTAALIVPAIGLCMSGAGFSRLVGTLYRLCGYAGAVIVFLIIIKSIKNKEK